MCRRRWQVFRAKYYRNTKPKPIAHVDSALAAYRFDRYVANVSIDMLSDKATFTLDEETFEPDELDPELLDSPYLASTRFDRMLKRLAAG